jgi:hypothetical protein
MFLNISDEENEDNVILRGFISQRGATIEFSLKNPLAETPLNKFKQNTRP